MARKSCAKFRHRYRPARSPRSGRSGSGKTTLLRIIAGLESSDDGEVFWNEERITQSRPQNRHFGMVFQDSGVYSHLTVERNLMLPLRAEGASTSEARSKAAAIASDFGIERFLGRKAAQLSGGEAQRLALARVLVRSPRLVLLDEPFSNLDAALRRDARHFVFSRLRERGTPAILVTHDHQDAQEAAGKVIFLDEGSVMQEGRWIDLYTHPTNLAVARLVSFTKPVELEGRLEIRSGEPHFLSNELGLNLALSHCASIPSLEGLKTGMSIRLIYRPKTLQRSRRLKVSQSPFPGR